MDYSFGLMNSLHIPFFPQQVQTWRGLILHPLKCKDGCCCQDDTVQKKYTVAARIMDVPQSARALGTFLDGISSLIVVVSSRSSEWDLKVARVHEQAHTQTNKSPLQYV